MIEQSRAEDGLPEQLRVRRGEGRCAIALLVLLTADGLVVYLCGGQHLHLGAAVLSLPRPSLAGESRNGCDSFVIPRPGHKDDVVAKALAEQLSKALNVPVCVTAGIHIESAHPDELAAIAANCALAGEEVISALSKRVIGEVEQCE
jgi:hypothetical protein